ncbi:MAG: NAD-dependent succinate-semialdehyde dehydrogenase [bacterium]|nr:NAD-dependent succinate-semialdehyde dehydrogenase [bacterium]
MSYQSINPYTSELAAEYGNLTDIELEEKLRKAHAAFKNWRNTPFSERAEIMRRAAALLRERREELGRINTTETGKLISVSIGENYLAAGIMDYYADHAEEYLQPHYLENPDPIIGSAVGIYQPLGIIYAVEPWNVPIYQAARPSATQLMAGNVILLKHASSCPQCALAMEQLFLEAGLPEGCFQNLFIDYAQSAHLIADSRIVGVTFTGNSAAGRIIAAQAGQYLKKSILELGGSDPMIVLPDADINKVIQGAIIGRLAISGQVCESDKRMFIHESLYTDFLNGIRNTTAFLKAGDPLDPKTTFAPLCSRAAAEEVRAQIAKAVKHGAAAEEIGPEVPANSAFVRITVLTDVTEDNPIFREEIFGPVLMVFQWHNEEEMLRLANATPYGLGASVYSEDPRAATRLASRLEAGMISLNQATMSSPAVPFGGIKESGYGRELGQEGIREFTNLKYINSTTVDMRTVLTMLQTP